MKVKMTFVAEANTSSMKPSAKKSLMAIFGKVNGTRIVAALGLIEKAMTKNVKLPYGLETTYHALNDGYAHLETPKVKMSEASIKEFEAVATYYHGLAFKPKLEGLEAFNVKVRDIPYTSSTWVKIRKLMSTALGIPFAKTEVSKDGNYLGVTATIGDVVYWVYFSDATNSWESEWDVDGESASETGAKFDSKALYVFLGNHAGSLAN
jgi:hypothetical protein